MSNMSYCRFHNTLGDLQDCKYALDDFEDTLHDRRRVKEIKTKLDALNDADDTSDEMVDEIVDLQEELDGLEDRGMSESERGKARALIELCREIVDEFESIDLE